MSTTSTPRALTLGLTFGCLLAGLWTLMSSGSASATAEGATSHRSRHSPASSLVSCNDDPRVELGLVPLEVCRGARLFFDETFDGNGRTCGSCHPADNNFTIDATYVATLAPDHPLFIAESSGSLQSLEIPELLRDFGLIRVNADGFDDLEGNFVMRSVSHTLSLPTSLLVPPLFPGLPFALDLTTSPPLERTGWGGDGAPGDGTLLAFSDGAIVQHATKRLERVEGEDFRLPTDAERRDLERFMLSLGRQSDIDLEQVQLSDPGAERGRVSFLFGAGRDCHACHDNAGANAVVELATGERWVTNFTFPVGTEGARPQRLDELGVPFDGGFGSFPIDLQQDGEVDGFGNFAFNTPPLIEAADTAPFFHSHGSETLEDAIRFYASHTFGSSLSGGAPSLTRPEGGPMQLSEEEISELARFLRILNVSFNAQIALQRVEATLTLSAERGRRRRDVQRGLVRLAQAELGDALEVLQQVPDLNLREQRQLRSADQALWRARALQRPESVRRELRQAARQLRRSIEGLGSGLDYPLGVGTLMF